MWFDQLLSFGLPLLVALIAIPMLIASLAAGFHIEPYIRRLSSAALPLLLLAAFALGTLVSGRNASLYGLGGDLNEEATGGASTWILRLSTLMAVGCSILVIVSALVSKRSMPKESKGLFLAFCAYYVAAYVVGGLLGTVPDISYKTIYPLVIVAALYITSAYGYETLLRVTRDGMFIFLVVGLVLLPIKFDLVAQQSYQGFVPGIRFRYWGLASHANNIGPLAFFFALIAALYPYQSKIMSGLVVLVVAVTLVLAQSKTTLGAALVVVVALLSNLWFRAAFRNAFGRAGAMIAIMLLLLSSGVALILVVGDFYEKPLELILGRTQGYGTNFTGRENIWRITMAEWRASPLFGYGPSLWGGEFSMRYGYFGIASNAHNQVIDTLGSAGLVGLAALITYVLTLGYCALRLANRTHWISVGFFLLVLVRCMTEVPLKTINVTTSDYFMHTMILAIFMRLLCEQREAGVSVHQKTVGMFKGAVL